MNKRIYNWLMALVIMGLTQNSFGILPGGCIFDERVRSSKLLYSNEVQTEHEAYSADIYKVGDNAYMLSMKCPGAFQDGQIAYFVFIDFYIDYNTKMIVVKNIRMQFPPEVYGAFLMDDPLGGIVRQEIDKFIDSFQILKNK